MPRLKLNYFNFRGRGEAIRLMLHRAKVNFEDYRYSIPEWFDSHKKDMSSKQLPYVNIQGVDRHQSVALMSYFASEYGMYGQCNVHRLVCDQMVQFQEQLVVHDVAVFVPPNSHKKYVVSREFFEFMYSKDRSIPNPDALEKATKTMYPRYLQIFQDIITDNRDFGSNVCVGSKISLADIILHIGTQTAFQVAPEVVQRYPAIMDIRQAVDEADGIKEYLEGREFCCL